MHTVQRPESTIHSRFPILIQIPKTLIICKQTRCIPVKYAFSSVYVLNIETLNELKVGCPSETGNPWHLFQSTVQPSESHPKMVCPPATSAHYHQHPRCYSSTKQAEAGGGTHSGVAQAPMSLHPAFPRSRARPTTTHTTAAQPSNQRQAVEILVSESSHRFCTENPTPKTLHPKTDTQNPTPKTQSVRGQAPVRAHPDLPARALGPPPARQPHLLQHVRGARLWRDGGSSGVQAGVRGLGGGPCREVRCPHDRRLPPAGRAAPGIEAVELEPLG